MTQEPEYLPPASDKVREGVFMKRGLPSGRMLTISLRWEGQKKQWSFDPHPSTWTHEDHWWYQDVLFPKVQLKLNHCYDLIEPGWVYHRMAERKVNQIVADTAVLQEEVHEEKPVVVFVPLTDELCRKLLPRRA